MNTRAYVLSIVVYCSAVMSSGCGDDNAPGMAPLTAAGAGAPAGGATGVAAGGAGGSAGSVMAGASGSAPRVTGVSAGTSAAGASGSAGSAAGQGGSPAGGAAAAGSGGSPAGGAAGATAGSSGGVAVAGSDGTVGGAGAPTVVDVPAPVTAPLIWGFGIGISDVPAAVKFYTEVMKMTVEKDAVKRDDSTETVLYGTQAMRGARLVLMKFDDMRNTRKITAKLVWQSQNASAVNRAASMYPDYVSRLNLGIVQFDGPETYVHEVGGSFDSGGSGISVPYPIALGFAVSVLAASRQFYVSLGMEESRIGTFSVTDANGTGSISEYSVKFAEGAGVVLQQWTPMRNTKDNPVKVIIFVPDAKTTTDKLVAAGGMIVKQAERSQVYDNRLLVVAKDRDGYLLDIVQ